MDIEKIIKTYNKTGSLKTTGSVLGIGWQKVRKMLITHNMYETDMTIEIRELHNKGFSVNEIANRLKISSKTVSAYLPYTKGVYHSNNPSENALTIRRFRAKNVV